MTPRHTPQAKAIIELRLALAEAGRALIDCDPDVLPGVLADVRSDVEPGVGACPEGRGAQVKKIPTLFVRDPDDRRHVLPIVTPGCEWVMVGEGVATRKYDGTCVSWHEQEWWFRREVKPEKAEPAGWVWITTDDATGKRMGWEPARPNSSFIKPLREAIDNTFDFGEEIPDGTYELCGPKINGNPEAWPSHRLIEHATAERLPECDHPDGFETARDMVTALPYEGIVWHHPDGRMAKLKRRDFT